MKLIRPSRRLASPGMIPLLDVMFLVMAAFMFNIHGLKVTKTLPLNLPQASQSQTDKKTSVSVSVNSKGKIYMDKKKVSIGQLKIRLQDILSEDPEIRILLRGDEKSPFGVIVSVLDLMQELEVENLGLETKKK